MLSTIVHILKNLRGKELSIIFTQIFYHFHCSSFISNVPVFPLVLFPFRLKIWNFNIHLDQVYWLWILFNFLLSENIFISHLFPKVSFAGYRISGCQFVSQSFNTAIPLSGLVVSDVKSASFESLFYYV